MARGKRHNYAKPILIGMGIFAVLMVAGLVNINWAALGGITPPGQGQGKLLSVYSYCSIFFSHSDSNQIVNMYDMNGVYLATATASSGKCTWGIQLREGTHVLLQGRQAAIATADPYVSPAVEFVVPQAGIDTTTVGLVTVGSQSFGDESYPAGTNTLYVRDVTATIPNGTCYNGTNVIMNGLTLGATGNLTYAATGTFKLVLTMAGTKTNVAYGSPDFKDMAAGVTYKGGIWVVWRGSTTIAFDQGSAREMLTWADPTYTYVAWNFDTALWYDGTTGVGVTSATFVFTMASAGVWPSAAETLSIDVFDMMQVTGTNGIGNFVDGGAVALTAMTAYIADS